MMTNCPEMFSGKDGKWFEDGIDYVSFHDGNLIDQVRYHLDRQDIRDRVEESIYEKYYANYAPKPFWKKMLNTCWVEV
jgi:spore maturation protein CgeB